MSRGRDAHPYNELKRLFFDVSIQSNPLKLILESFTSNYLSSIIVEFSSIILEFLSRDLFGIDAKHGVRTMHSAPHGKVCALRRTRKCAPHFNVRLRRPILAC